MCLDFLDGSVKAELSNRRAASLGDVQGNGLVALLARQRLLQAPGGGRQVQGAVLRDAEVPGEVVEGHREAGVQFGHGEKARCA